MKEKVKQDAVNRLSRMAGQVNGIKKMVEDER
ncbi:MAG: metal-sensing transcriptional repressor [Fimbriimonadaceae bacterium]|nr:metal-sensing transcriptional repressor [Fimbriimonadaceae bacterium]